MKRKITFSLALLLSIVMPSLSSSTWTVKAKQGQGAFTFPGAVTAPKQRCTITPTGTAIVTGPQIEGKLFEFMARWDATVSCEQSTPLEGSTVEVRQRMQVRLGDNGRAMGRTEIMLGMDEEDFPANSFSGRVAGLWTMLPSSSSGEVGTQSHFRGGNVVVDLDIDAHNRGGGRLRGSVMFELEGDTPTHEVISFTPGPLEVKSGTEFGVILSH